MTDLLVTLGSIRLLLTTNRRPYPSKNTALGHCVTTLWIRGSLICSVRGTRTHSSSSYSYVQYCTTSSFTRNLSLVLPLDFPYSRGAEWTITSTIAFPKDIDSRKSHETGIRRMGATSGAVGTMSQSIRPSLSRERLEEMQGDIRCCQW